MGKTLNMSSGDAVSIGDLSSSHGRIVPEGEPEPQINHSEKQKSQL